MSGLVFSSLLLLLYVNFFYDAVRCFFFDLLVDGAFRFDAKVLGSDTFAFCFFIEVLACFWTGCRA